MKLTKNLRLSFYVSILSLLFIKCVNTKGDTCNHEIINIDLSNVSNELNLPFSFDTINTYKLNVQNGDVIGIVDKVLFKDDKVLLLASKQKQVFIFNNNGEYLNKIHKSGSGPGEYTSINNIFLKDNLVGIVDIHLSTIFFYDYNGDFVNSMSSNNIFRDIIAYNDSFLCYTPDFMSDNAYGIWLMNSNGNLLTEILRPSEEVRHSISVPWYNILESDNGEFLVYYTSTNKIFSVKDGEAVLKYEFDVNRKTLSSYPNINDKRSIKDEYYEIIHLAHANKWIYSSWANTNTYEMVHTFYDIDTKESYSFKKINLDNHTEDYRYPVFSNRTNSLMYISQADELQKADDLNTLYLHELVFSQ